VTVVFGRGEVRWGESASGGPRWLAGIALRAWVERGGVECGARAPRVHAGSGDRPHSATAAG
jgi:hypothetical protein